MLLSTLSICSKLKGNYPRAVRTEIMKQAHIHREKQEVPYMKQTNLHCTTHISYEQDDTFEQEW